MPKILNSELLLRLFIIVTADEVSKLRRGLAAETVEEKQVMRRDYIIYNKEGGKECIF